ncbi:MAG: hypothetical protein KAH25_04865 [Bacteroidales bacterium]|nr:hypothetical protein [Bacteroidales bacterium]
MKATSEQVEGWKAKHGSVFLITSKDGKGKEYHTYIKRAEMITIRASAKHA